MDNEIFTVRGINSVSTMTRSSYEEYQRRLRSRRDEGRYTLEEAAIALGDAGERADEMLKKLMQAARDGVLPVYEPGRKARYTHGDDFSTRVREFYEEARWWDLNKWLADNEALIRFEFPAPFGGQENNEPPPFRPRIGWQVAMFDAWPAMRKLYSRDPIPAEAIKYLKQHDTSGVILKKGGDNELWWKPNRKPGKEIAFSTIENTISDWRTRGVLPT